MTAPRAVPDDAGAARNGAGAPDDALPASRQDDAARTGNKPSSAASPAPARTRGCTISQPVTSVGPAGKTPPAAGSNASATLPAINPRLPQPDGFPPQRAACLTPARIAELRQQHQQARDQRIGRFRIDQRVGLLMRGLANDTDRTLRLLWAEAGMPADWALFAVGGYGRGELQPCSDVDLLLLGPEEGPTAETIPAIECFIGACWDIGLEIGHSVRSPSECAEEAGAGISTMTALLERRLLIGGRRTARLLTGALAGKLQLPIFLRDKLLEMRQRHHKFEDTPYSLEPNCKESPGALRDLQVISWISHAAGLGRSWGSLVQAGVIEPLEARQLQRYERLLKRIRAWLHILAGRREDRLIFDLQPSVASAMNFRGDGPRARSEKLMRAYYLAAKAITQLSTLLVQSLEIRILHPNPGPARPIDDHFDQIDDKLDLRDPDEFERDPRLILRAFRTLQLQRSLNGMTVRTLRALWHARFQIDARYRRDPVNRACFLAILQTPEGITHTLRLMNQWSVLGRYFVPFWRIVGRMQHDLFHVYTVDQHTLMVIRNLRRFMMAEHAHEYPFCSQLMSNFERPWVLIVAALFHDIGKGRGGDHSLIGERTVLKFARDYGLDNEDRDLLGFLVREHLVMSMTAQKRDLADPGVIRAFADRVGDERRLTALYLLTVADIRGTSARVWNGWKAKLLEDLFRATQARLNGLHPQPRSQMDALRTAAASLLSSRGIAEADYRAFWDSLDIGYFLRHDPQDLAWHTDMLHRHAAQKTSTAHARTGMASGSVEFLIFTPDKAALFARICRFFDEHRLSIAQARIHTTREGMALDSFIVVTADGQLPSARHLQRLESALATILDARIDPGNLKPAAPSRLSRRSRAFPLPPTVELRPDESGQRYLLSITATDRPGLLYDLARLLAVHDVGLFGARITTLGERAEDTFIIGSEKLGNESARLALEKELLAVM